MTGTPAIYGALTAVMRDVQSVGKDDENTAQGGGFKFRGIDALLNAVGPALREHGVLVMPEAVSHDLGEVEVGRNRTRMSNARVMVRYTFYAEDGSSVAAIVPGEAMDAGDKATPKALSQAFKYALVQALAIPTGDPDPDSHSYERGDRAGENAPDPWADLGWKDEAEHDAAHAAVLDEARGLPESAKDELRAWLTEKGWAKPHGRLRLQEWMEKIEELTRADDHEPRPVVDTADPTLLDDGRPFTDD